MQWMQCITKVKTINEKAKKYASVDTIMLNNKDH